MGSSATAFDAAWAEKAITAAWENRQSISPETGGETREAVEAVIDALDRGAVRIADPAADGWRVNQWAKQAVLLFFRLNPNRPMPGGPAESDGTPAAWFDRVASKFTGWREGDFTRAGFRAVPGAYVRRSAYIAPGAVLMPSFVNVGAYVDEGTMIDTWATVGSCAQVGKNVHLSGGAGLGGVLEPLQAEPVIVEDGAFIGARAEIAEGVRVGAGAVIAMGTFIGASTKIIDRETGEVHRGAVPPGAVVVPGTLPGKALPDGSPGPALACAVIVKKVDEGTRAKTSLNELLRLP